MREARWKVARARTFGQCCRVTPKLRAAALSDIGLLRHENQDRCLFDEEHALFGVADGVGGLRGGAAAATAAAEAVESAVRALPPGADPDMAAIVREAHLQTTLAGKPIDPAFGIATTLTFGCQRGGRMLIAHVGDSRCYVWRGGKCFRLTEDHSVENEAKRRGEPFPAAHAQALVRSIGQSPEPVPDLIARPLLKGERYLFCTDGIARVLAEGELCAILGGDGEPADVLGRLIALALRRGGPDNASGVLVFVDAV